MKTAVITLGVLFLTAGIAGAGPGDPFGGDDTGCVGSTPEQVKCEGSVAQTIGKLVQAVVSCHLTQAGHAFKNPNGVGGYANAEEGCESGNPSVSAKAKFDERLNAIQAKFPTCPAAVFTNATALRDVLLGDQNTAGSLHEQNAKVFCDNTSGLEIDPGGDDGGFIPASEGNLACAAGTLKAWTKLWKDVMAGCHNRAAIYGFKDRVFDEEACEDTDADPLRVHSALGKYKKRVQRLIDAGVCPTCLADSGSANYAIGQGTDLVTRLDQINGDTFVCPAP